MDINRLYLAGSYSGVFGMSAKLQIASEATVEDELRGLLRALDKVEREKAQLTSQLPALRQRYASEQGQLMLPSMWMLKQRLL